MRRVFADPLVWVMLLGFGLPFLFQMGWFPFQKLSMFSEDPSAYKRFRTESPARP